ncbi:MAG: Ig domain-containing protein, partial [Solirubrobacteraceae bacterium]
DGYVDDNRLDEPTNTNSGGAGLLYTPQVGTYEYTVTATSKDGATASEHLYYNVADPPTATIISPAASAGTVTFPQGSGSQSASFSCADGVGGPGISTCSDGTVHGASGTLTGSIATTKAGTYSYRVTATSLDGLTGTTTLAYTVTPPLVVSNTQLVLKPIQTTNDTDQGADADAVIVANADCGDASAVTGCVESETSSAENAGLTQGQADQIIAVGGGPSTMRSFSQVTIEKPGYLQPSVYAYVPASANVVQNNIGGSDDCQYNFRGKGTTCVTDCSSYNGPLKPADLGRLKAQAVENVIRASKNVASVLYAIRVTRTRLIASTIARKAKPAEFQTAVLAALDGELAGWLQERNGWCRVLAAVVRVQHGAKRTAAFTRVLDTRLPDALFAKAVHNLTRKGASAIVAALAAQGKIQHANAIALRKAAERGSRAAFVAAARSVPFSTRLLLDVISTAV